MIRSPLEGVWTLHNDKIGTIPAKVPGCVHTDLCAAGIIKDIYWRDNNKSYQWIEECDFSYECSFDAKAGGGSELVFEGLDTYAEITLNGKKLGETDDMFIPHRFPVSDVLRDGVNTLKVKFRSPTKEVADRPERYAAFTYERLYTRRMQCTYGWDWVDRFVTSGIFRPVYLEYPNGIEAEDLYIYTESLDTFGAGLYCELNFKNIGSGAIAEIEILDPDGNSALKTELFADRDCMVRRFNIEDPKLWYPNGYGDQPLYTIRVKVGENTLFRTFGIRTLRIIESVDKENSKYRDLARSIKETEAGKIYDTNTVSSGFQVVVNGKKIFCKGGNWVPAEPFPSEESDEKITKLVRMAKDMGANTLRVWGGGIFEKESFYNECDRSGILVLQDFLMACGNYPEGEEWFIEALDRESEYAAKYLRNHPSLAWWHGDNENAIRGSDTLPDYRGRASALKGLIPNVTKYDRFRTIFPSSPYGGDTYASLTRGTSHTTNYLGMVFQYFDSEPCSDYKEYLRQFLSRFISEEGTFGAVMRKTMLKFMTEEDLISDPTEDILLYHTKNNPGLKKHLFSYVKSFAEKVLGDFIDGEDKFFKYKYIQYEWIRVAFENVRRNLGYCNGLIFWMFNDCWPASMGWALVDYYLMPKDSYYAFMRGAKHVTGSVVRKNNSYELVISTDNDTRAALDIKAYLLKNGLVEQTYSVKSTTDGYGTVSLDIPFEFSPDALIVADIEGEGILDRCFYKDGKLNIRPAMDLIEVLHTEDGKITIKALGYVHAVELEAETVFSDNCFQMLEGEVRTVELKDKSLLSETRITAYTLI